MNEATIKMVEELAAKLGTTTEMLWGVLIKQAPIEGWSRILGIIIFGIIFAVTAKLISKRTETDEYCDTPNWCLWLFWSVLFLFFIVAIALSISGIVASFINPEYWALQKILRF